MSSEPTTHRESDTGYSVRSLARGLGVLRCFDVDHPEWGLGDLARATGLNKVTVFRLAKTLESEGFLTFDSSDGKYHLGSVVLQLSYLGMSNSELVRIARPRMRSLAALTGESVDLGVRTTDGVLLIAQELTSRPFKPVASVGRVFSDLASSHSKLYLAFGPASWEERALAKPRKALTPKTIMDPALIREEVARVVERGVAYDFEEQDAGICSVAAPVRDVSGDIRATLSVVAPVERFGPSEVERLEAAVVETARGLSADLGYRPCAEPR